MLSRNQTNRLALENARYRHGGGRFIKAVSGDTKTDNLTVDAAKKWEANDQQKSIVSPDRAEAKAAAMRSRSNETNACALRAGYANRRH